MKSRAIQSPYYTRVTKPARCSACGESKAILTRYYRDEDYHELLGMHSDCAGGCGHKETIDDDGGRVTFIFTGPPEHILIDDENAGA